VWLLFLLFRSISVSRPILAAFGQPGAGKSTLFRRIYRLLYGRSKSVLKVTTPENFDMALAYDPFIVADNVDTPERWLPDRLALAASSADIPKRKLYTDADEYILRCQALVGVTAHNPRFTREDVSDRLILLTFKRLDEFVPEGDILDRISERRNYLWGGIVRDCQRILGTPYPHFSEIPQFRVEDFARSGFWIASALGDGDAFKAALASVSKGSRELNLSEDQILVDALRAYVKRGKGKTWASAGGIWSDMQVVAPDAHAFMKLYRGAIHLGKKLLVLQDSLKEVFEIEVEFDKANSQRRWKFGLKDENT
jgi:GTPase SAR1 family protein